MKLLVLSDSHRKVRLLEDIINANADSAVIIFLGDGEDDFNQAMKVCTVRKDVQIFQVRGNCDHKSWEKPALVRTICGLNFISRMDSRKRLNGI